MRDRRGTSESDDPPGLLAIWSTGYGRGVGGAEQMVNALIRQHPDDPQVLITNGDSRRGLPGEYFAPLPAGVTVWIDTFPNPLLSHGPVEFVRNVARYLRASARLWRFLRRRTPAVVHQHLVSVDLFLLALFKYLFGYRLVVTFCGGDVTVGRRSAAARVKIRTAVRCADAITAVSADLTTVLREQYSASQAMCIPNGVDVAMTRDSASRGAAAIPADQFVFVGRLHPDKRVLPLVQIFKRCVEAGCDRDLYLIGDGPERDALVDLIGRSGLTKRVFLLGALSHDRALACVANSRCLLLLSSEEGCPNVILEAMALSVPTIATAVGGVPDLVADGGTGYLVPGDRPEDAVARILELSRDSGLAQKMGRAARDAALTRFSLAKTSQAYRALYRALESRPRSAAAPTTECPGINSQ